MTFTKIQLGKGSRTMSGEIIAERHGIEMWDDLLKWLDTIKPDYSITVNEFRNKMRFIELDYGIHRVGEEISQSK